MTGPYGESRWDRLAASLTAAGIEARVCGKPYVEQVYGRVRRGVSHSITLHHPDGGLVQIRDVYRRGAWIGWEAWRDDSEGIVIRTWMATKKRGVVVQNVLDALTAETVL